MASVLKACARSSRIGRRQNPSRNCSTPSQYVTYVIDHQYEVLTNGRVEYGSNPTGSTATLERRLEVLALSREHDFFILEGKCAVPCPRLLAVKEMITYRR